jgi:hypothetical protein
MMQSRVCKYLRHPSEALSFNTTLDIEPKRMDPNEIDLCIWLTETRKGHDIPPALLRRVGGGTDLNDGDCDKCQCFEPVVVPPFPAPPSEKAGGEGKS